MTPPTWVRTLLLADPLEGVRSVGAVENDANLRPATAARDRIPPGRHRSSLPPPHGHCWPIPCRASAPSAPRNDANLRPATAATEPQPSRTPPILPATPYNPLHP